MTPEPKKPIEELLESSAKARRAQFGDDPRMPNPMRARLQEEMTRVEREKEEHGRSRGFVFSWPRLIIGAAVAAIVVGAPLVWLRQNTPHHAMPMAMKEGAEAKDVSLRRDAEVAALRAEMSKERAVAAAKIAAPPPAAPPAQDELNAAEQTETKTLAAADTSANMAEGSDMKKFADVALTPSVALAEKAPLTKGKVAPVEESHTVSKGLVASAPAAAAAPVLGGGKAETTANFRQQFAQALTNQATRFNQKMRQSSAGVLNNFEVEQQGSTIRVVDADGSTYTGKIEQLSPNDARNLNARQNNLSSAQASVAKRAAAAKPERARETAEESNEYYFNVSGNNLTTQRRVVFEGNYIMTPQQRANRQSAAGDKDQQNARIVGTAKISGESPVEIDAVAVTK